MGPHNIPIYCLCPYALWWGIRGVILTCVGLAKSCVFVVPVALTLIPRCCLAAVLAIPSQVKGTFRALSRTQVSLLFQDCWQQPSGGSLALQPCVESSGLAGCRQQRCHQPALSHQLANANLASSCLTAHVRFHSAGHCPCCKVQFLCSRSFKSATSSPTRDCYLKPRCGCRGWDHM